MPVVGPLQVPPPVGGGETHAAGPGAPTCVDREVFSSNEFFSITTSRSITITTSFALLPTPQNSIEREDGKINKERKLKMKVFQKKRKGFSKTKKISGEVKP
jgi:hypothetical protein